jgi:hypothetical protein
MPDWKAAERADRRLWLEWQSSPSIQRFQYDGKMLSYTLEAERPLHSHAVEDIAVVCNYYCRRRLCFRRPEVQPLRDSARSRKGSGSPSAYRLPSLHRRAP